MLDEKLNEDLILAINAFKERTIATDARGRGRRMAVINTTVRAAIVREISENLGHDPIVLMLAFQTELNSTEIEIRNEIVKVIRAKDPVAAVTFERLTRPKLAIVT